MMAHAFRRSIRIPSKSLRGLTRWLGGITLLGLAATSAHAVPSYARQTGAECSTCHIGAYGPQLTPYGIRFKLGGYTESDGQGSKIPLSAMIVANYTHTKKDAADADVAEHFDSNNNFAVQETSLFLAGKLLNNVGAFIQETYSGVDRKAALDQVDIRWATTAQFGGKDTVVGVVLNSNPTLTDPFNTLGQWRFPYTASDFNAGADPSPIIEGLASSVVGLNAYAFYDDHFYAEVGLYKTLSTGVLDFINGEDAGKFKGVADYWRLAYFQDWKKSNFSVGVFGFDAKLQPDREDLGVADRYHDLGVDASYQFLGNRDHIATVNASYTHERQKLNYTFGVIDEADDRKGHVNQFRLATSYHYLQSYGGTVSYFSSTGDSDVTRYGEASLNGSPNTKGYMLQLDWTPWGKEGSWGSPWVNARVGLQYTGYSKFMGGKSYLDGDGNVRSAHANNTLMLFLWASF